MPGRVYERMLRNSGAACVVGVDEVGRGAWAGPLVAAAVIIPPRARIAGVRDSKLLNEEQREEIAHAIQLSAVAWSYGVVSYEEIDVLGLTEANRVVFERALQGLSEPIEHVLIDGGYQYHLPYPATCIKNGDRAEFLIAAASVVAKVFRDRLMRAAHLLYPEYGFGAHKGYGTGEHRRAIRRHGVTLYHRKSFIPGGLKFQALSTMVRLGSP